MAYTDVSALVALVNGKTDGGLWVFQDPANMFTDTGGTTPVATAGTDKIARCNDLSGNARHLLQATGTKQPTWNKTGTVSYASFAPAALQFMRPSTVSTSATAVHTHFIVLRPKGAANAWFIGGFNGASSNLYLWDSANARLDMYNGHDYFSANNSLPADTIKRLVLEANGTSGRIFINGTQDTSDVQHDTGAIASNHITLGNDGNLSSSYWNGDILAVGWFVGTASAGDLTTIETTLTALMTDSTAPVFSVNPSISPGSGTAGSTLFTATDGTASNTTTYTRRWLLNGSSIGTGTTVTPASAGTLVLEVTATGSGGSTIANSSSVTVSAAAVASGVRRGGMALGLGLGLCFSSGGGAPATAPSNTVAPVIEDVIVGVPLTASSNGTWTGSPTGYAYTFFKGATNLGSSYTPLEADRTSTFTVQVAASNSGGSASATSAAKTCRRTALTVAYNYGALTPNGWGFVTIANLFKAAGVPLLGTGVTAPDTWTVAAASTGTDAHWTRTSGFTPKKAATLADATYVFTMTASWTTGSITETQTLTITPKALTANVSEDDAFNRFNLFGTTLKAAVDVAGGRVEFSVGMVMGASQFLIQNFAPTNTVTWANSDLTRPLIAGNFDYRGLANCVLQSFRTGDYSYAGSGRLTFTGAQSSNCTINDYRHEPATATYAFIGGNGVKALYLGNVTGFTVTSPIIRNCGEGIVSDTALATVVNGAIVDNFYDNGIFPGGDSAGAGSVVNGITFNDCLVMRPQRVGAGTHVDFAQVQDQANGGYVRFNRLICVQAGGGAYAQPLFCGAGSATAPQQVPMEVSVTGFIGIGAAANGMYFVRGNNSTIQYYGVTYTTHTNGSGETLAGGPTLLTFGGVMVTGTNTVRKGFMYNSITIATGWTDGLNNVPYLNSEDATHFLNGKPQTYVEAISDVAWLAYSDAQVISAAKAAMRPAIGSVLDGNSPIDATTGNWNATVLAA